MFSSQKLGFRNYAATVSSSRLKLAIPGTAPRMGVHHRERSVSLQDKQTSVHVKWLQQAPLAGQRQEGPLGELPGERPLVGQQPEEQRVAPRNPVVAA